MRRLPFEPLRRYVQSLGAVVPRGTTRGGISSLGWYHNSATSQTWWRAKREGSLTFRAADKMACSLGRHPAEIWGSAWYQRQTGGR